MPYPGSIAIAQDLPSEERMVINQFKAKSVHSEAVTTPLNAEPNPTSEKTTPSLRTAKISEQKYITASMVLAFGNDPATRWMYPDPDQYLTHFPRFVQAFGGKAFAQETAYCIDGYAGAALWFPPGVDLDAEPIIELVQESIVESNQADIFAVFEQMEHYHLTEPHWYLPMIGVEPTQQGKGYGSALMQHVLRQCDRDRLPAYLESSNPENIPFYNRHGFELLGTIQAGSSPTIFPMVRYPQLKEVQ
jgi:GNAT superfamily N-acetyltransferase